VRVCHVSPHLPPDQAANALLPAELGCWAHERGDEVSYVAHEPAQDATSRPLDLGPRTAGLTGPVRWVPRRRRSSGVVRALRVDAWRVARQVSAALDDVAAHSDLLHLHSNGLIIEVAAAWARRQRRPYVLTLYGTEIWHYRRRWPIDRFTRAYAGAAHVTFYSHRLLDRARAEGLDRSGVSVVYPAVSDAFTGHDDATRATWRAALGIRERHVVLNVKRLHRLAGQTFLIDAFARVAARRPDVRLVLCGAGPLRSQLEGQAQAAGIAHRVTFAGLLPNEEVARYAAVADVFALPSLLEALPTVAVEALASGTPVVSTDSPGGLELHELFGDDVTIVPREDAEALAGALDRFIGEPRRTRAGTADQIASHFRAPTVWAAFTRVYAEALGRHAC
jgi:glycosyltransferase involved in cell wall biosynthesis